VEARSLERGVTLLDVLVTLGIAAVIAASAAPRVFDLLGGLELRAGAMRVSSAFVRARLAALSEARTWVVRTAGDHTIEIGPLDEEATREDLPGLVRFARATSGGEVRFAPSGWAENATFTVARGDRERAVTVNQRGRVTLREEVGP